MCIDPECLPLVLCIFLYLLTQHMAEKKDTPALINAHLPPQIRVVVAKRVTKSFDSRHACTARMYEYLLPTYALAPYHQTTRDFHVSGECRRSLMLSEVTHVICV